MQEVTGKLILNVIRFTDQVTPEGLPLMRQSYSKDIFVGVKALENLLISKVKTVVAQPVFVEVDVKDGDAIPSGATPVVTGDVVEGVKKYRVNTGTFEEVKIPVNGQVPPNAKPLGENWSEVETITTEELTKPMLNALKLLWKDREDMPSWATIDAVDEIKTLIV